MAYWLGPGESGYRKIQGRTARLKGYRLRVRGTDGVGGSSHEGEDPKP